MKFYFLFQKFFQKIYNFIINFSKNENVKFYYLSLKTQDHKEWFIHGLWPQYSNDSYPTYCKKLDFDYKKLLPIIGKLNRYWYSDQDLNEKFWEHEWKKHGSCMKKELTEFEYFNLTLKLFEEAIYKNLPSKYEKNNQALIPVNLNFKFRDFLK